MAGTTTYSTDIYTLGREQRGKEEERESLKLSEMHCEERLGRKLLDLR